MPSPSYRLRNVTLSRLCFWTIGSDSVWCRFRFSFITKLTVTCILDRFYLCIFIYSFIYLFSVISYFFFIVIEMEIYVETNI